MNKHQQFGKQKKNTVSVPSARIEVRPDGIIYVEPRGNMTGPVVETLLHNLRAEVAAQRRLGKRVRILSNIGSITGHNSAARSSIKMATDLDFDKGAAYGGSLALGLVMQYLQRSIDPERTRYFRTEHQALEYLQASTAPIVAQRERSNARLTLLSGIAIVILLTSVVAGWRYTSVQIDNESHAAFVQQSQREQSDMQKRLDTYVQTLYGFRGLYGASNTVERNEFDAYFKSLNLATNFPGVSNISYIKHLALSDVSRFTDTVRADTSLKSSGYPNFQIRPAGARVAYDIVTFIEPVETVSLGFDLASDPARVATLNVARDSGQPTATTSIKLLDSQDQGFLVTLPIYYNHGAIPSTVEQRRSQLEGYVNAVLDYKSFFSDTARSFNADGTTIVVYDGENKPIYQSGPAGAHSQTVHTSLNVGGRHLYITHIAARSYGLTATTQTLPLLVLLGGLAISMLLLVVAFTLMRSRREAIKLAEAMTTDLEHERNVAIDNQAKLTRSETALAAAKATVERKIVARTGELREARAQLEASLNGLPFGYLILDAHSKTVFANAAMGRLLHTEEQSQVTLADIATRLQGVVDIHGSLKAAASSRQLVSADCLFGTSYLTMLFIPIIASSVHQADTINPPSVIGSVIIVEDVTEEKALARSRDEFFSIASHELRTPLTAMRGNAAMMLDQYAEQLSDPTLHQMTTDIHDSSVRLIAIVNDFLDMSRLEQGSVPVDMSEVDLAVTAANAASAFAGEVLHKGITLKIVPTTKHVRAQTDGTRVEQIISSLLSNAIRITTTGCVSVEIDSTPTMAIVRVIDTGAGIPEAAQHLLFRKFQQASADTLTRDSSQSTGLKLYISRLIAQLLGGKLYLERSDVGKGSTFTLELPIRPSHG